MQTDVCMLEPINWFGVLWPLLLAPLSWFVWTALHELSHGIFAKYQADGYGFIYYLHPHRDDRGEFFFARVVWLSDNWDEIDPGRKGWIFFAPRFLGILSLICFPLLGLFSLPGALVWAVVWAGGVVDTAVGSMGISPRSDLRKYSRMWGINPWIPRVVGWALVLTSASLGLWQLFLAFESLLICGC